MIKQSRVSPKNWLSMFTGAAILVVSLQGSADTAILYGDEDITGGTFQVSNQTTNFTLSAPFVCGNAGTPTTFTSNKVNATFPGATPANGNFLFGHLNAGAQVPLGGLGAWTFSPSLGLVVSQSDPALACYSLSTAGARRATPGLFVDSFDEPYADAAVNLRVVQLPSIDNSYIYKYYVDLTLPANTSSVSLPFSLRDGFDSSVFGASGAFYCEVAPGVTSCSGQTPVSDNLEKLYMVAPGAPPVSKRFIVSRPLRNAGDALPNTGAPLALAAVFSLTDLETRLDNNVSAGFGSLSDFDPVITTTSTNLSGLSEGGILPGVTFSLSDDTTESSGLLLGASVSVDFNGTLVPVSVNCGSTTPNPGPGSSRNCSFDIVPSENFATDVNPGTYANGVHASVIITATDPRGQSSSKTLQFHVASSDNDAPVFTVSSSYAPPDSANNNMPTITCNRATGAGSANCTGVLPGFVTGLAPGPLDAVDERASQTTFMVVSCVTEAGTPFATSPSLSSEGNGSYRLNYQLNLSNAAAARCAAGAGEGGGSVYPSGQGYRDHFETFRIVIL